MIKDNIRYFIVSVLMLFLIGCCYVNTWNRQDFTSKFIDDKSKHPYIYSPLYYRGSDKEYHYFIFRYVDEFVNIRVKRDEISIDEIKPPLGLFKKPFPGYYAVDPNNNFNRLENPK